MIGKTILLVEDDPRVMRNNMTILKSRKASVLAASTLAEARRVLVGEKPDMAVLDVTLPDGSGLDLLKEIRSAHFFPVLFLSAKDGSEDIINGLSTGADDYLAKPYDLNVLTARIEAVLRRAQVMGESVEVGTLQFNLIGNQALYCGIDLSLTQKEFGLLFLLAKKEKETLSPEYLFEKVWHQPLIDDTGALRLQMSNLKKKLAGITESIQIETSRGEGYCLVFC
jgi:DNA-binding response OmpR family regulator